MKINHAILHVFDFVSCENVFAQEEIDLHEKNAKNYVQRLAQKCLNNLDNKRGEFSSESVFAQELDAYFKGNRSFSELSQQIGEYLAGELGHMEKTPSCDLLVVDFEVEPKPVAEDDPTPAITSSSDSDVAPWEDEPETDQAAALGTEENEGLETHESQTSGTTTFDPNMADILEGLNKRYFAIILLESKQAYMHDLFVGDSGLSNTISRHFAILPNPSQKVQSAAVIDLRTQDVLFVDKKRTIAGEEKFLIPDGLLQCSAQASTKEVVETVTHIVEEVAQEYGANPTVAVTQAKAYATECANEGRDIDLDELSDEVFGDREAPRESIREYAQEREIPQQVAVEKEVVKKVARTQKIRTDTGIEITFPAEYVRSSEFISFTSTDDGTYSISLNNITSIENR